MTYRDDLAAAEAVIAQLREELAEARARIRVLEGAARPPSGSAARTPEPAKMSFWKRMTRLFAPADVARKGARRLLMTSEKFLFASNDKRLAFTTAQAARMASVLADAVTKQQTESRDMDIVGSFERRPVRVRLDLTFGGTRIDMRGERRFPSLRVEVDNKTTRPLVAPPPLDEWDQRDQRKEKRFFSSRAFAEATPPELDRMEALWNRLPAEQRAAVLRQLDGEDLGAMYVGGDGVQWTSSTTLFHEDVAGELARRVRLVSELFTWFEEGKHLTGVPAAGEPAQE